MKNWKRLCGLLSAAALCLGLLAGCAEDSAALSLTVCAGDAPKNLDPIYAVSSSDQTVLEHLYENLMRVTTDVYGEITVTNDAPARLAARRQVMRYLYEIPVVQKEGEDKDDFKQRKKDVKHPVVEKLFREIAPKYKKRAEEKGQGGGYTRLIKKGPRRGDAAEMVILELI